MRKEDFPDGKIRFEIEELGPIRDSVIDFKPFLIFSGESNTGKSFAAMAVYYLFYMLRDQAMMEKFTLKLFDIKKIEKDLKTGSKVELELPEVFLKGLEKLYNDNIGRFLGYMLDNDNFSRKAKLKLKLEFPGLSESKAFVSYREFAGKTDLDFEMHLPHYDWEHTVAEAKNVDFKDNLTYFVYGLCMRLIFGDEYRNFFLPPARGAFSGLGTLSMWEKFSSIGMYKEFLKGLDGVRFRDFDAYDEELDEQKEILEEKK